MAFDRKNEKPIYQIRELDPDQRNDLRIIRDFEEELMPFMARNVTVMGKVLTGFELYLHDNALFRYSRRYPCGAVVWNNLDGFHHAQRKWRGLTELQRRRDLAEKHEKTQQEQFVNQGRMVKN